MKRKTVFLIIFLITLFAAAAVYVYFEYYAKGNANIENQKTDFKISSVDLISEFEKNDTSANSKYNDKVLEITGKVNKTIPGDSITSVVMDEGKNLTITIEMYARHNNLAKNLKAGDNVTIKGLYVGYIFDPLLADFGEKGDIKLKKGSIVK